MKGLKKVLLLLGIIFSFQLGFAGMGEDFSQIRLKDVNGKEYSFGDKNKKIFVELWASWCPYCVRSLPHMEELSIDDKKDFEVVTVVFPNQNGEMSPERFTKWYKKLGYKNVKVLLDENGEFLRRVRVRAFPTSVFLNKHGKLEMTFPGTRKNDKIKEIMANID